MRYTIETLEVRTLSSGAKLIDLTAKDVEGNEVQGTIWEKDKNGATFPNFDNLTFGSAFEAEPWKNPSSGKITFYAPKPKPAANAPRGGANIAKAQETKRKYIEAAQENKALGIKVSAAMRDATSITLELMKKDPEFGFSDFETMFRRVRDWYIKEWSNLEESLDLPF